MTTDALEQMKAGVRAAWAAGDYPAVARRQLWPVGERVVGRLGVSPGERVIDVACGTGNGAIRAATAGGHVVGVDLTPELLIAARREAREAGVEVEWIEGDAEALPVADEEFDVAISVFGCIYAPRHEVAASELARVLRPGGRLCLTAWDPDGYMGEFFRTIGGHMPPPPDFAQSPLDWGSESHVRELFADTEVAVEFVHEELEFPGFDTIEEEIEYGLAKFGPLVVARRLLEPAGRWQALVDDLRDLLERERAAEYVVILGSKR